MALYNSWIVTKKYAELEADASTSGNKIEFVKMIASSDYFEQDNLQNFTDLILESIKVNQEALISSVKVKNAVITITSIVTSKENQEDFDINTLLLVCRYNGVEFLAASTTAITPFRMPAKSDEEQTEYTFRPQFTLTNTDTVSTIVDPVSAATNERVNEEVTLLNKAITENQSTLKGILEKLLTFMDDKANQTIDGVKTFTKTIIGSISGNAGSATKLQTARKIGISGDATGSENFDGTVDITIPIQLSNITQSNTTSAETATNGGKIVVVDNVTTDSNGRQTGMNKKTITLPAAYAHPNFSQTDTTTSEAPGNASTFTVIDNITRNGQGHVLGVNTKTVTLPTQTAVTGNAGTATKLQTGRTIGLSGDVTGTATTFDGSKNITISTTLPNVGSASTYGPTQTETTTLGFGGTFQIPVITTDAKGRVSVAKAITFNLPAMPTSVSGNAGTATKLATTRALAVNLASTATSVNFDGSGNQTGIPATGILPIAKGGTGNATGKANNDSDIVHKTGNESIAGNKTFTGPVMIKRTDAVGATIFGSARDRSDILKVGFLEDDGNEGPSTILVTGYRTIPGQTTNNMAAMIQTGGLLILGGGEGATDFAAALVNGTLPSAVGSMNGGTEHIVLAADNNLFIGTNYQNGGNTGEWWNFTKDGKIITPSGGTVAEIASDGTLSVNNLKVSGTFNQPVATTDFKLPYCDITSSKLRRVGNLVYAEGTFHATSKHAAGYLISGGEYASETVPLGYRPINIKEDVRISKRSANGGEYVGRVSIQADGKMTDMALYNSGFASTADAMSISGGAIWATNDPWPTA